ncbi:MAG: Rne/Rng family ribonuclease [Gammaproteobacteria bacterium]
MKRILMNNSYNNELRIALIEGSKLYDLDSDSDSQSLLKGSIFKAKVSRIESSLDAAFVDFGSEKHGFLPLKELTESFYIKDHSGKKSCTLKDGDEIIVQILKEERGTKGAALSTQLSLAGRFLVLIPNSEKAGGVSRRISGEERDQVKTILQDLNIPEGMSVIVRTAGLGRNKNELQWDLNYLISLWEEISKNFGNTSCPTLIYKDDNLLLRVFRDYYREDIEEILIDDKNVYQEALAFAEAVIPDHAQKVKFYDEDIPLFNRYQVESQIESAFNREITLPSGGALVIDPTEAMVTIDVNSARATKGRDIEETALATNLEAAHEIARQLRLRDLGGLIVIDFIDMVTEENQKKVEQAMRHAVHSDRARIQISDISKFGLLELSRQRLRPSLNETYDIQHVMVRGPKSLGDSILRIISEDTMKENTAEVHAFLPSDVASYLLNEKRREIIKIEDQTRVNIVIIADPYRSRPYYKVIRIKDTETKARYSFDLAPSSPDPKIEWRNTTSSKTIADPLVKVSKPPKRPKKTGGLLSSITSLFKSKKKEEKKSDKPVVRKKRNFNKQKNNKNITENNRSNKPDNRKNENNSTRRPRKNPRSVQRKSPAKANESSNTTAALEINNNIPEALENNKPINNQVAVEVNEQTSVKTEKPIRALNDPRYKSE